MTHQKTGPSSREPNRLVRLFRLARSHGKLRALYRVVRRLTELPGLRWCFHLCVVEVFRVPVSELKSGQRVPRAFVVRRAEEEDRPALNSFFPDHQNVGNRFQRGDVCLMTVVKGEIGAAVWLAPGPNDYHEDWKDLRCIFHFPAGVCWSFDGRGTRLGAWGSLMARLPEFLKERGITEIFTQIECDNRMSLDSHKSLGYQSAGLICRLGCLGISLRLYKLPGRRWRFLPGRIGKLEFSGKSGPRGPSYQVFLGWL